MISKLPVMIAALSIVVMTMSCSASPADVDTSGYHYPYAHLETKHCNLYFESDTKDALAPFYADAESTLEYAWDRYRTYTGYDLDKLAIAAPAGGFEKPKYVYEFLNPSDMWDKGWGGGLTAWNHSQMGNELVPDLTREKAAKDSAALGIMWHELANGWANVYCDYKGQDTNLPIWWGSEGQAGFLKQHALMDSGYCSAAVGEYAGAVKAYDQYVADRKTGTQSRADPGAITHVLLESLWQRYGWTPIRYVDKMVQTGKLRFPKEMSDGDRNGEFVFVLCHAVKQNLLPFTDASFIEISLSWRTRIDSLDYPRAVVPIARNLDKDKPDAKDGDPFAKRTGSDM